MSYHADTVIRRANVITIDPSLPRASAVAMRDGRFIGVGSDSDVETLIGPNTKILDLAGKTVLPGFIDAHIHVLSSGTRHVMAADCSLQPSATSKRRCANGLRLRRPGSGFRVSSSTTPRPPKTDSSNEKTSML